MIMIFWLGEFFKMEVLTGNFFACFRATGVEHLNNVATGHDFKPWEVQDAAKVQRQDLELYHNSPEAR